MVTSLSACLGRKIRTKKFYTGKVSGGRIKLGGGPHPAPGPPVEQPCSRLLVQPCLTIPSIFYWCQNNDRLSAALVILPEENNSMI